jgi:hypothetical protein
MEVGKKCGWCRHHMGNRCWCALPQWVSELSGYIALNEDAADCPYFSLDEIKILLFDIK